MRSWSEGGCGCSCGGSSSLAAGSVWLARSVLRSMWTCGSSPTRARPNLASQPQKDWLWWAGGRVAMCCFSRQPHLWSRTGGVVRHCCPLPPDLPTLHPRTLAVSFRTAASQ